MTLRWLPHRFNSTRAQRHDPATGLFGERGRWDAARQRREIARLQRERHPMTHRAGTSIDPAPRPVPDDLVWRALAFTFGVAFGVLFVSAYLWHRLH